jgi:hypothetical protein
VSLVRCTIQLVQILSVCAFNALLLLASLLSTHAQAVKLSRFGTAASAGQALAGV